MSADLTSPRVSILIPNFNNGKQSSRSGDIDLIGNLLQSLWDTLHDEPTPFELLVHDDQSTDDSIETIRAWAEHTWPNGEPFLHLTESPHEGFIAKANNRMYAKARGDIFVRLDGDVVCLTRHWVSRIAAIFDHGPQDLGIVGPKQLSADGTIHAFGDWLLHPNGYTHIAAGQPRYSVRWPIVCEHTMGCFYCCKREMFHDIGGYDEKCLRGETEDFTFRARLKGWTCLATPEVEFVHYHGLRHVRSSKYDSSDGVKSDLKYFEQKWGFNRIAPDLDVVRDRYAGTPLVWNARWFASDGPVDPPVPDPLPVKHSDWHHYQQDQTFRHHIDRRVSSTLNMLKQIPAPQRIVQIGAGSGLIAHLLAMHGIVVTGVERAVPKVELARRCVRDRDYPAGPPSFVRQRERRTLPLDDHHADVALIFDTLERDANPMGLLKETRRVLRPGGVLLIMSPRHASGDDAPTDAEHRYCWTQLWHQLLIGLDARLLTEDQPDNPDLIAVAQLPAQSSDPRSEARSQRSASGDSNARPERGFPGAERRAGSPRETNNPAFHRAPV